MKYLLFLVLIFEVQSSPANWFTRSTTARSTTRSTTRLTTRLTTPSKSGPPTPVFISDNYIPAAMHVLFHLSDLMKYESKPPSTPSPPGVQPSEPTSTTVRPTQPHKPGNYAPDKEGERVSQSGLGWSFGWGKIEGGLPDIPPLLKSQPQPLPADIDLFGAAPSDLLHQINTLEDTDTIGDDDVQVEKFAVNYDDTVNLDFLRQKKTPPTRAFVTVLSLFDLLNKESKELGLNKFNGYSESMLQELQKTSEGSSTEQLKFVLSKIIDNRNTRKDNILKKIKQMIVDLEKPESYINMAIKYLPPLQFSL